MKNRTSNVRTPHGVAVFVFCICMASKVMSSETDSADACANQSASWLATILFSRANGDDRCRSLQERHPDLEDGYFRQMTPDEAFRVQRQTTVSTLNEPIGSNLNRYTIQGIDASRSGLSTVRGYKTLDK